MPFAVDEISRLCDKIVGLVNPAGIIIFNKKMSMSGELSSFKLCVIAEGNPGEIEGKIYLNVDCPIHFDVLVYSVESWRKYLGEPQSFAYRISKTGGLLYGRAD